MPDVSFAVRLQQIAQMDITAIPKALPDEAVLSVPGLGEAERDSLMQQLREAGNIDSLAIVGRAGEALAAKALEAEGSVLWVNERIETGLPFDIILRPSGSSFADLMSDDALDLRKVAALAAKPGADATYVEVKASLTSHGRDIFDVAIGEVVAAQQFKSKYWVARVGALGVAGQRPTIRILRGIEDAFLCGRARLLMVA